MPITENFTTPLTFTNFIEELLGIHLFEYQKFLFRNFPTIISELNLGVSLPDSFLRYKQIELPEFPMLDHKIAFISPRINNDKLISFNMMLGSKGLNKNLTYYDEFVLDSFSSKFIERKIKHYTIEEFMEENKYSSIIYKFDKTHIPKVKLHTNNNNNNLDFLSNKETNNKPEYLRQNGNNHYNKANVNNTHKSSRHIKSNKGE